jgi:hypothetical protein
MFSIKAEYLGNSETGVKVHSKFLANCDASSTFEAFKLQSISKNIAPFFIDLFNPESSTNIQTIGVSEATYKQITGEEIMSSEYYEREALLNQDYIFGAMEQILIKEGLKIPWNESESLGLSALKIQKFRQSDHAIIEMNIDDLELTPNS